MLRHKRSPKKLRRDTSGCRNSLEGQHSRILEPCWQPAASRSLQEGQACVSTCSRLRRTCCPVHRPARNTIHGWTKARNPELSIMSASTAKSSYPDPTQKPVIKRPHLITSAETQKCNQSPSSLVNLANHARLKAINPNRAMDPERLKSRQNRATAGHSQKPTARLSGWQPFRGYRLICSVPYVTS